MPGDERLREIERLFATKIPLTQAMQVRALVYDETRLVLEAPLEPNHNHLGTAFGGSLAALLVLTGYGLLWLELDDPSWHLVVRDCSIQYRAPVTGPLRAIAPRPPAPQMATFRRTLERKGRARIELTALIEQDGEPAAEFRGMFVALRP